MACPQCFSGHVNSGTPLGRWETVHGLKTYVSDPPSGKEAKGIIVIIPDAFGVNFINNQILADHYAAAGPYKVYLPEFMNGTAASVRCMKNMAYLTGDASPIWAPYYLVAVVSEFIPFLIRNRYGVRWPTITKFFKDLREEKGNIFIGAAGFCWGGLYGVELTHDKPETKTASGRRLVDASFVAHPSNLTVPKSFEDVAAPLSVAIGDSDAVMSMKQVEKAKEALKKKPQVDSEVVVYPGAKHGFSVRASRAVPDSKETQQAEEAEQQAIAWFQKHLPKL